MASHTTHRLSVLVCGGIVVLAQMANADAIPDFVSAAVADPGRPDSDQRQDAQRKPAEAIAFAGLKPGDRIAEFLPGSSGYFTKIFCTVAGDSGHVYVISAPTDQSITSALVAKKTSDHSMADQLGEVCANGSAIRLRARNYPAPELYNPSDDPGSVYEYYAQRLPVESFVAPEPLDAIWTAANYYDLYNKRAGAPNMMLVNTALLNALRPGGVLIVEDHSAPQSDTPATDLHRIDPGQVKEKLLAAGFEFVDRSDALRHTEDVHTAKANALPDRTGWFLLKFRRPLVALR